MPTHVPFLLSEDRLPRGDRAVLRGGKGLYPLVRGINQAQGQSASRRVGPGPGPATKTCLGHRLPTQDHETRMVVEIENDVGDGQDSAEEWRML